MVLHTSLLNTQQYKVRIKDIVENPEKEVAISNTGAFEKGAFWLLSTTVANFTLFYYMRKAKEYIDQNIMVIRKTNKRNVP